MSIPAAAVSSSTSSHVSGLRRPSTRPLRPVLSAATEAFAADVRAGLGGEGQKSLPSRYLYDALGSALFEAITVLPEYGVTRAEERLLDTFADALAESICPSGDSAAGTTATLTRVRPLRVVELGSGSGRKTRAILQALAKSGPLSYCPIDISPAALAQCCAALSDIAGVTVQPFESDYLAGMSAACRPGEQTLVLFLGSTIGNFAQPEAAAFLQALRTRLQAGDALLLGADLLKPVGDLLRAYDDNIGVTAAFNLNLLGRMNRELDADFALDGFAHMARFNPRARSVEMHLRALRPQHVAIRAAGIDVLFEAGETIWTESSHKYTPQEIINMGKNAGFALSDQWTDDAWPFAETLLTAN